MARERILVVEDEPGVLDLMMEVLGAMRERFTLSQATNARDALEAVQDQRPHLVLLDLNLERRFDGLDVCKAIRRDAKAHDAAVIILTGELMDAAETMLLDAGADDYVRKPQFTPALLESRVRAVLRRTRPEEPVTRVTHGPLVLDPARRQALVDGRDLHLTPTEFDILYKLAGNADRALSRLELLERGGEGEDAALGRTVDVHVLAIRRKLERCSWLVETVFGVGYRIGSAGPSPVP